MTPERPQSASAAHIPALDGLRGLAILLVIPHNTRPSGAEGVVRVFTLAASMGWIGVQLFFVLSGFLITINLLDSLGAPHYYRAFYARRTLRIFPLYYCTLAVLFVVLPALGRPLASSEHQIWFWLYLDNWTEPMGRTIPGLGHFWSLAIEEQFYLVWPFLVVAFSQRLIAFCLAVAGIALASRFITLWLGGSAEAVYHFTFCRMDALALGAAAAVLFRRPGFSLPPAWSGTRLVVKGIGLIAAGALLTGLYPRVGTANITFGFTLLSIAFAMIIYATATPGTGVWRRVLEFRPLRSAGKYSYAMYIFHWPLDMACRSTLVGYLHWTGAWLPVWYMAVMVALSYAAGVVSYHVLEKHFLSLKKHFVPNT